MDTIEFYDIHMSLQEGMVRNMFPNITNLVHGLANKKNTMLALDDYVRRVSKGEPATGSLIMTVAGIYSGVHHKELQKLVNKLINLGRLDQRFNPA